MFDKPANVITPRAAFWPNNPRFEYNEELYWPNKNPQMIDCDFCNKKFPVDEIDIEINFGRYQAYCGKCDE